jgi:exopolysaccharide biosynthesis polyprenyl glycosylphosphotransferase
MPARMGFWYDVFLRRTLAVADATAGLAASVALGLLSGGAVDTAVWAAVLVPCWILLAKLQGLYDRDQRALRHLTVDELSALAVWAITGTATVAFLVTLTPAADPTLSAAVWACVIAFLACFALRATVRFAVRKLTPRQTALVVGEGPLADATRRKLELFPDIHARIVDQWSEFTIDSLQKAPWWPNLDRILLASEVIDEALISELVAFCRTHRIKLSVIPPARGLFGTAVQLDRVAELPVIQYNTWDVSRSTMFLKRVVDLIGASVGLILLAPLFPLIALAIKLDSRGPVLFTQARAGQHGRPYRMHKFRTMVAEAEDLLSDLIDFDHLKQPMFKFVDDPRVTRVGRFLRRTSLDELPQLWNVLTGDMSLVGPRPEQLDLVTRYADEHRFRLAVKPGITGPMQVYGRGRLTFPERLSVEREYIENLSLGRDLRILALTPAAVFTRTGAY